MFPFEKENETWALKRRKGEFPFIYLLGGQEGGKTPSFRGLSHFSQKRL